MALADYYARSALAASQVLSGFDEERIRAVLDSARVGLAIGTDAPKCSEGRALLDLLVRLLARLYPTVVIRSEIGGQDAANDAMSLARAINPNIDFASDPTVEIAIGAELPPAGGWEAKSMLGLIARARLIASLAASCPPISLRITTVG